ncbi:MAG TPA: ATP-dependent Clp protease adaptor ClpS [Prolixibacteraceae bacterium]|nr:ATP-dependent Clp protease adaptor ClpS [Prolixibacteraceae bacterium]
MTKEKYKEIPRFEDSALNDQEHELVLLNDDVHTFDYVIDALIKICDHTPQQATQCTLLIHYKGSCDVKKGDIKTLRPLRKALIEKELNAKIV